MDAQNQHVLLQEVFDLSSSFWCSEHTYSFVEALDRIPSAQRRRILELYYLLARCSEESQLCIADIVNLHTSTTAYLSTLHLHMLHIMESYLPDTVTPRMTQQLFQFISKYVSNLPQSKAGEVALLLETAEYAYYRLHRIEDITHELSSAYWSSSDEERSTFLKKAKQISAVPIFTQVQYTNLLEDTDIDVLSDSNHGNSSDTGSMTSVSMLLSSSCISSSSDDDS